MGALAASKQAHDGPADGQSPAVQYAYQSLTVSGDAKNLRLRNVVYPNDRAVYNHYGSAGGMSAALNRVEALAAGADGQTQYAHYSYLGAAAVVKMRYPAVSEGELYLTHDPDGNASYAGLDRFGRVIRQVWVAYSEPDEMAFTREDFTYRYDRNSNRLYRKNQLNGAFSELYHQPNAATGSEYDGLDRLVGFRRGTLSGDGNSIASGAKGAQEWNLDAVGNWRTFKDDATDGTSWDVDQSRTHNAVNELVTLSGSGASDWLDPNHDAAGNMTSGPDARGGALAADANFRQFYFYDAWNRMTKLARDTNADGDYDDGTDAVIATYSYDGDYRRIRKHLPGDASYDYYYNEAWQCLEERGTRGTGYFSLAVRVGAG